MHNSFSTKICCSKNDKCKRVEVEWNERTQKKAATTTTKTTIYGGEKKTARAQHKFATIDSKAATTTKCYVRFNVIAII